MIKKIIKIIAMAMSLIIYTTGALAGYTTLRLGDSGEEVRKMQEKLKSVGYNIKVDGNFGKGTLRELKRFQKAHGLKMDGTAGNATLEKLYGVKAGNKVNKTNNKSSKQNNIDRLPRQLSLPQFSLAKGDIGDDVKYMQLALNKLGYTISKLDGNFGSGTQSALKRFQRKNRLSADGVAGDTTLRLIYRKCGVVVSGRVNSRQNKSNNGGNNNTPGIIKLEKATMPRFSLRQGMQNNYVRDMQIVLAQLGFYRGNYDGNYGSSTAVAVKSFQRKYRLSADGIAGNSTLRHLYKKAGVKYEYDNSDNNGNIPQDNNRTNKIYITNATIPIESLRYGQRSNFVKEMQLALMQLGYNITRADGKFGDGTRLALLAFQRDYKLGRDGIAGRSTLKRLYEKANVNISYEQSNSTIPNVPNKPDNQNNIPANPGRSITAPNIGSVRLMHWYREVKPLLRSGAKVNMYDPNTNSGYELTVLSCGRHLDAEPSTASDTERLNKIFGGVSTWTPRILYAQLPNGQWSLVSTHNMPHLSGNIRNNNFNGHLCVHFLRDMSETMEKDPHYGVQNQNNLRSAWKRLTGETVD